MNLIWNSDFLSDVSWIFMTSLDDDESAKKSHVTQTKTHLKQWDDKKMMETKFSIKKGKKIDLTSSKISSDFETSPKVLKKTF